jgi:nucleotide-binding universal stress UspA family protein
MSGSSKAGRFHGVPNRVVVPIPPHWDGQRVVPAAAWLATRSAAPMLLLTAVADPQDAAAAGAELAAVASRLRRDALVVETFVRHTHDPGRFILEEASKCRGSVVAMATHAPGRLADFTLGTVTQEVVHGADAPVLLVGPHVTRGTMDVTTLVAGLDGSAASDAVVEVVGHWAGWFRLGVELLEVVDARALATLGTLRGDVVESGDLGRAAAALRPYGVAADWDTLHRSDPATALVERVQDRPGSLLVVGTHGRGGVSRLVLGSVAMRVVHDSPVPVVVVR